MGKLVEMGFLRHAKNSSKVSLRDFASVARQSRGNPYFQKLWNLPFFETLLKFTPFLKMAKANSFLGCGLPRLDFVKARNDRLLRHSEGVRSATEESTNGKRCVNFYGFFAALRMTSGGCFHKKIHAFVQNTHPQTPSASQGALSCASRKGGLLRHSELVIRQAKNPHFKFTHFLQGVDSSLRYAALRMTNSRAFVMTKERTAL